MKKIRKEHKVHSVIKMSAVAISLSLLSACGGSSSNGGDKTVPPKKILPKSENAYFEKGIQDIRKDYLPLRLHINSMREEAINFSIGLPTDDGYSHFIASNLNKSYPSIINLYKHPNMIKQEWRSGNDHSIQIHSSQVNKNLKLKVSDSDGNKPWKLERDINVVKDAGYVIVTPQEADIEGKLPVAFVEGLDSNAQTGDYYSFVNRFSDPSLGSIDSDICLVAISLSSDTIYPVDLSLKQEEATKLRDLSTLAETWRLAVVTKAELKVQSAEVKPTYNQLMMIQSVCSDFTVGNGETLRVLEPKKNQPSMTAYIIYSPADGEVAFTNTSVGLNSLAWASE